MSVLLTLRWCGSCGGIARGVDQAGHHAVGGDLVGAARSWASALVKPTRPAFAVTTCARLLGADVTADAADVDDGAGAAGLQMREGRLHGEEGAVEDDGDHFAPVGERHVLQRPLGAAGGVVDQDVDAPEALGGGRDHALHGRLVATSAMTAEGLAALALDLAHGAVDRGAVRRGR